MPTAWRNVRFRGRSGKHMLGSSFSGFDPGCVKTCASLGCPESFLICLLPTEVASAISFYSHEIEMEILRASWASAFSHSLGPTTDITPRVASGTCYRPRPIYYRCNPFFPHRNLTATRAGPSARSDLVERSNMSNLFGRSAAGRRADPNPELIEAGAAGDPPREQIPPGQGEENATVFALSQHPLRH